MVTREGILVLGLNAGVVGSLVGGLMLGRVDGFRGVESGLDSLAG